MLCLINHIKKEGKVMVNSVVQKTINPGLTRTGYTYLKYLEANRLFIAGMKRNCTVC